MCELDPPTRDFGSLVRIKKLFPDQPAQQSGRIQEGDVLLAVNGQSLKELSYPVCADCKLHLLVCESHLWSLIFLYVIYLLFFHLPVNLNSLWKIIWSEFRILTIMHVRVHENTVYLHLFKLLWVVFLSCESLNVVLRGFFSLTGESDYLILITDLNENGLKICVKTSASGGM